MIHSPLLAFLLFAFHPFYVSIISISSKPDREVMEISCRIFYDDLEKALGSENGTRTDLINPPDRPAADSAIARYIRQNLGLSVNGKALPLRYLGYDIEEDVAWCFFEAPNQEKAIRQLGIKSELLYRHFDTQSNIFHITVDGKRKSTKLDNPRNRTVIDFR